MKRLSSRALLNRVLKNLAGPELRLRARCNLHRLAGPGVAPGRRLATGHREIAESDKTHLVAPLQGRRDHFQHRLDRPRGVIAAEPGPVRHMADEFLLVHAPALLTATDSRAQSVCL